MGRTIVWKTIGSQVTCRIFTLSQDVKDFQNNGNLLECTKGVKLEFAPRVQTPVHTSGAQNISWLLQHQQH